ncbi:SdpI family protein [Flavobacterium sp. RHBU_3]|uniref:SdpI family protein n=1 Tax=Flavobacterium sp. RHBU_3 TaxID=3391184 RepID=UPI00398534EB
MNPFFENIALPGFLSGIAFAFVGSFMHYSPPSEINGVVGYRTKRSMKSQAHWDFAQRYSGKIMGFGGLVMAVLSALTYFVPVDVEVKQTAGLIALLVLSVSMIVATEVALKRKFKD